MSLTTLTCNLSTQFVFNTSLAIPGLVAPTNSTNINKTLKLTTGTGAAQSTEIYAKLISLATSASTTIDLTNFTDVQNQTASLSAVKGYLVWVLSATDTAPDGSVGTAASSVNVGGGANAFVGAITSTLTVPNGGTALFSRPDSAGWTIGSGKNVLITNNDGANAASVLLAVIGN